MNKNYSNKTLPNIYTQTEFDDFANNARVKSEIKIGEEGINYPIFVNGGTNVSLCAAYLIEFNEGFEVDVNKEFFADVSGCIGRRLCSYNNC